MPEWGSSVGSPCFVLIWESPSLRPQLGICHMILTPDRDSLCLMEYSSKGVVWIQKVEYLKQMPEFLTDFVSLLVGYGWLVLCFGNTTVS